MKSHTVFVAAWAAAACGIGFGCAPSQVHSNWSTMPPTAVRDVPAAGAPILLAARERPTYLEAEADALAAERELDPRLLEQAPIRLRVVTFNMEHRNRDSELSDIAGEMPEEVGGRPEFVLLQEVRFSGGKRNLNENTAEKLGEKLGYNVRATKRTSDSEGVAILSRFPFEHYDAITHKAQTSRLLLGFNRVTVMGEFRVPRIGLVRVVNVHFTNWDFDAHVRRKQLSETLQWVAARERIKPAEVTILGGDFNIEPDSSDLDLVADRALTGSLKFTDYNSTLPTRGSPGRPNKRIDYLFIATRNDHLRMLGEQRLFMDGLVAANGKRRYWPSDHTPVFHEYAVTPVLDGATVASVDVLQGAN